MEPKTQTSDQSYSEAEAAKQADKLIRQTQASAQAAEAIAKAQQSSKENPRNVQNVRKLSSPGFGYDTKQNDSPHATIDKRYRDTSYKDKMLGPAGLEKSQKESSPKTELKTQPSTKPQARGLRGRVLQRAGGAVSSNMIKTMSRIRATQVNISALSWVGFLWLAIQLPFAVLVIITLGVVGAIGAVADGEGGFFAWVGGKIIGAIDAVAKIFGVDFTKIAFDLFLASQVVILSLGICCILALYLQYKMAGLNPFFGEGASFKIGMFILTIIGYSMPVLNTLPFIFLWMLAVWLRPR